MKKIFILVGLLSAGIGAFAENQYTYTPSYISHLKACSVYSEDYSTEIPTNDVNTPSLKVKSTEEILGYLNAKCYTKSTVYSYDLDKVIMTIKCGLNKNQRAYVARKMNEVNMQNSKEAKKALQDELTKIIEDKNVCRVKNYLEE
ncbi:hypothetical protein J6O86_03955 [bacterium]|nr:hypothetical protein [bacterium]